MKLLSKFLPGLFITNAKKEPVSAQEFQNIYLATLREKFPDVEFTAADDFSIRGIKGEGEHIHYLHNAYDVYKADISNLVGIVNDFTRSAGDLYKERSLDLSNIVPVIKPVEYLDIVMDMFDVGKEQVSPLLADQYNEDLIIAYANDEEHSLSYLREEDLGKLGLAKENLLPTAIDNLKNKLPDIQRHGEAGFYMLTAGGVFEISLILLPGIWDNEQMPVNGDFVIAIPNRDMLLVTGSRDTDALQKLQQMATDSFNNGSYAISPDLYRLNGERFSRVF
ncbi:MAG: DUF1444 family protein [Chitinophagaceae bacterium]